MNMSNRRALYLPFIFLLAVVAALCAGVARADPPSSIARLSYMSGPVSFSPAGEDQWVYASTSRPLIPSDRIWVPAGSRAELQTSGALIRIAGGTSLELLNVDDRIAQVEMTRGTIVIRIRRDDPNRAVEINTPNLALSIRRAGTYRITVNPADDSTSVVVREGNAEVFGDRAAHVIRSREAYQFFGVGLRDFDTLRAVPVDEFDRWVRDRDRRLDASVSARYVSSDVLGYQDLDSSGTWRTVASYGPVWFPKGVSRTWAPYTDGHWSWIEPWGWTWVDAAPWGFAVSHYGRWTYLNNTWGWVPGPARERAVYAPAVVAFVDGRGVRLAGASGEGAVAWFPLAPREVYRPAYTVSREYLVRLNRSNTAIDEPVIANSFNNTSTSYSYINQRVPGAVVAVPRRVFIDASPVSRMAVRLDVQEAARAPVAQVAMVAPVQRSVFGPTSAGVRPPPERSERPVIVRTAPPAPTPQFSSRQQALSAAEGRPLPPEEVLRLRPQGTSAVAPQPQRTMVAPQAAPSPMATVQPVPAQPDAGAGRGGRGRSEPGRQGDPGTPAASVARPGMQPMAPTMAVPDAPPADQRQAPGQRQQMQAQPSPPAQPGGPGVAGGTRGCSKRLRLKSRRPRCPSHRLRRRLPVRRSLHSSPPPCRNPRRFRNPRPCLSPAVLAGASVSHNPRLLLQPDRHRNRLPRRRPLLHRPLRRRNRRDQDGQG